MKIQKAFGRIWIGPGDDVAKICQKFVEPGSVDIGDLDIHRGPASCAVLNVADDYPEYPHPPEILYIHAGLNDGPEDWSLPHGVDNSIYVYMHALQALIFLSDGPWDVFVHCHGGVSRAPFVVACYISWLFNVPYSEALNTLKALYPRANPHPKHEEHAAQIVETVGILG